jgi:hypothetical protein
VKSQPIVELAHGEVDEIRHRQRRLLGEQLQVDGAAAGDDVGLQVLAHVESFRMDWAGF